MGLDSVLSSPVSDAAKFMHGNNDSPRRVLHGYNAGGALVNIIGENSMFLQVLHPQIFTIGGLDGLRHPTAED
jgi:hypothetical protein